MTIVQQMTPVATLTAGPWGTLYAAAPQGLDGVARALVAAGQPAALVAGDVPGVTGLNFTGMAAVLAAAGTYYSGLSAAERAQLGYITVSINQFGISIPCDNLDIATLAATLAAILDMSSNYGAVGT
jgi:hypothetical protein